MAEQQEILRVLNAVDEDGLAAEVIRSFICYRNGQRLRIDVMDHGEERPEAMPRYFAEARREDGGQSVRSNGGNMIAGEIATLQLHHLDE